MQEQFQEARLEYSAAQESRFRRTRTVPMGGASGDYHIRNGWQYFRMMEYARNMDMNDALVGPMIDMARRHMVQDGFHVDPQTGSDDADAYLRAKWEDWAGDPEQCDVAGEFNFYGYENQCARSAFVDGDCVVLGTDTGALQFIEGHRIKTPNNTQSTRLVHGVQLDSQRRRMAYWISKDEIGTQTVFERDRSVPVPTYNVDDGQRQVFHYYMPNVNVKRYSLTRGVSALHPCFDVLGMFEDINFAKLVQQQSVSCNTLVRKRGTGYVGGIAPQHGPETTSTGTDGFTVTTVQLGMGTMLEIGVDESIEALHANIPNAEYFDQVKLIMQLCGINLGLPLVMLLMDASETNFSGYRGAVDTARMGFRQNQKAAVARLHTPVYRWKVAQWIDSDPTVRAFSRNADINVYKHVWNVPRWRYIEPLKDAMADKVRMDEMLTSPRRLHAEQGNDWDDIYQETIDDRAKAIEAAITRAKKINETHGDFPGGPIHWYQLISLPSPKTLNLSDLLAVNAAGSEPAGSPAQTRGGKA